MPPVFDPADDRVQRRLNAQFVAIVHPMTVRLDGDSGRCHMRVRGERNRYDHKQTEGWRCFETGQPG